jgi:hypothetical protein
MNADDTDFGEAGGEDGGGDVEFVPVPGGYGFERVRLRMDPSVHRAIPPQPSHRTVGRAEHSRGRRRHTIMLKHTPFWDDLGWGGIPG